MRVLLLLPVLIVAGCAKLPGMEPSAPAGPTATSEEETPVENVTLAAPPPPPAARTVEQFDTTTAEQRAAVSTKPAADGQLLGSTVASLGDPSRSGFWCETPLVDARQTGRLVYPAKDTSVEVELIPTGDERGAGSRVSLAAFRVLEAPLTDLPTLDVYAE